MSDELIQKHFEKLWIDFRKRWCDNHDLAGAQAFSHDLAKIVFFHRVVNISVDLAEVDRLIDDAIRLFQEKSFDCIFTLSPLDRPANLGERLVCARLYARHNGIGDGLCSTHCAIANAIHSTSGGVGRV